VFRATSTIRRERIRISFPHVKRQERVVDRRESFHSLATVFFNETILSSRCISPKSFSIRSCFPSENTFANAKSLVTSLNCTSPLAISPSTRYRMANGCLLSSDLLGVGKGLVMASDRGKEGTADPEVGASGREEAATMGRKVSSSARWERRLMS
jgi:hypothetical protein